MTAGLALLVLLGLLSGPLHAQTVTEGFHGYDWGQPGREIPEIDVSRAPERRAEGLLVYARTARFLGVPTRVVFYLDPEGKRLRKGKYLMEPDPGSCVREFTTVRLMIGGSYEGLREEPDPAPEGYQPRPSEEAATGPPAPAGLTCGDFLGGAGPPWRGVRFVNPGTGEAEVRAALFRRDSVPRILVCYLVDEDCEWPEGLDVEPGPKTLAPARMDTAGGG